MILIITLIISFVICIIFIAVFIIMFFKIKNKYHHQYSKHDFSKDEMIAMKLLAGNFNQIYSTSGEVANVIDKYILSYNKRKCYLICNYVKKYNNISMKVLTYNEKEKLKSVYDINETGQSTYSSVIKLPSNTKYVNIFINNVDNVSVDETERTKDYKKLIKIETYALFFGLFPIAYLIINMISGNLRNDYFKNIGVVITLFSNVLICIINYIIISRLFVRTNSVDIGDCYKWKITFTNE